MSDFKLEDSSEYQQIKEYRRIAVSLISRVGPFMPAAANASSSILSQLSREYKGSGYDANSEKGYAEKRAVILKLVMKPEQMENAISEFVSELNKSLNKLVAVSNYAFAEFIFWNDCELAADLKKYRSTTIEDMQAKSAKLIRKQAEESYRGNWIDDAIKKFKDSEAKYGMDCTVHYQLGLIYFFEKSDHALAIEYFKKAAKYAQDKCNPVFVSSMIFIGLILRLIANVTKKNEFYAESYQAIAQAYGIDPNNSFTKYALAQINAAMLGKSGAAEESAKQLKELVQKDKLFAIQSIYDRAFEGYLTNLENFYKDTISNATALCQETFKKIEELLAQITKSTQYMAIPSKVTGLKNDFDSLTTQLNNISYFETVDIDAKSKVVLNTAQELNNEITKNKTYFELKSFVQDLTLKYNEEANEALKPYIKADEQREVLLKQLEELNKKHPEAEPEKRIENPKKKGEEEYIPPKPGWETSGYFKFIRLLIGCFCFFLVLPVILIFLIVTMGGMDKVTDQPLIPMVLLFLNLVMILLYQYVGGEVYYMYVENKRKGIKSSITKLEKNAENNKSRVNEIDKKIRDKYTQQIIDKFKVSQFSAEQMLDAGIEGTLEKIKNFIS